MSHNPRAILVVSLLIVSFFVAPPATAVHDAALFELDGNALASASPGDDWASLFPTNTSTSVFNYSSVHEPEDIDTTYFSVSSKDINDINTWSVNGNSAPPKDEIINAFAAAYNSSSKGMIIYFGADRWANNGDAAVGFWFLQSPMVIDAQGQVVGNHTTNDTLVVSHFTNGGAVATIYVYKWVSTANPKLQLITTGADCATIGANDMACARVNSALTPSVLPYQGSGTKDPVNQYPANSFFEGGVNLSALYGGAPPCFTNFVAETRSSQETTAVLKDVAFQSFNNCPVVPPQSTITVDKVPLAPIVDLGQPIGFGITILNSGPDPAENLILWDQLPNVTGTWTLGGANATACSISVTNNLTCSFGTVPVEQGGGEGTRYIEVTAGTSAITDCGEQPNTAFISANDGLANDQSSAMVYVWCSDVGVVKTAAQGAIDLGANITFTLLLTSYGPDAAMNVTLDDTLPDVSGAWALGGGNASDCALVGDALSCAFGTVNVSDTRSVTLTAATAGAGDCGWQNNTAFVRARVDTNMSNNASSASVYVRCADVSVDKAAFDDDIYIGTNATFTITVSSHGPDAATNVTLTDELPDPPGGWSIVSSDPTCGITGSTLDCSFGTIPVGSSRAVTLTAATGDPQTDCGEIVNTANVSADIDLNATNSSDTASIIIRCSDVSVLKTAAALAIDVGATATFNITVSSGGPDTAQGVTLTDTLPSVTNGWTLGGTDAGSCGITGSLLTCSFGDLAPGATRNVSISTVTTLAECGPIDNVANVSATVDISLSDNSNDASIYVTCADVGVEKTAADGVIDVGETANFSIVVTSHGPDAAVNVTLTDTLPALAGGWTLGGPDAGDCSLTGLSLSCNFGTMANGATRTIWVLGATALDDCGWLNNTAVVDAVVNTNASNDEDSAQIYVTCADVGIEKSAFDATIDVGENATYTIEVTSSGPDAAENVTVNDTLPTLAGAWALDGPDAGACAIVLNAYVECDFGTVPAGETRTFIVTGTTSLDDCGTLDNVATVAARLDTNAGNNTDGASVYVTCADVGVVKTAADETIDVGGTANFSIVVTSFGPDPAEDVDLTDLLPGVDGGWTLAGPDAADCNITAGTLSCLFGTVNASDTRTIWLTATPSLDDCGPLPNTASVSARLDTNASNNEDGATIYVECADVGVQKSANDTAIDVGDEAAFAIVLTSFGPDAAEDVGLTDTLPALAGGWTLSGPDADDCSLTGLSLTCLFGTVNASDTRTIYLTGLTTTDDCGSLPNTATATARLDTNSSNDEDSASIYVTCADVDVDKTDGGDIDVGQNATFSVTVTSLGPDPAANVQLTDTLPAVDGGWTLGGPDAGDCLLSGLSLSCDFGTVNASDSRTITLTGATALADCGEIVNTASVSATVNTNDTNDNATARLYVTCADVGIQKSAGDDTIDVGEDAWFSITVTSFGPDAADNVTVEDTLPTLAGGWTLGGTDAGDCTLVGDALACDFGTVPASATRSITLNGSTTIDDCGALPNLANVSARLDTNASNNADDASIYVTCADVGVQKTAADTVIDVGETANFSIVVTSFGPDDAESVMLNDTLPALAGGWTLGGDNATACSLTGPSLTCDFGTVPAGQTRSITLTGATTLDDCGPLDNWATVGARLDTDASNNVDDATIYVTCSDVSIAKTAASLTIDVFTNATFTLTVTSLGPDAADNVSISDPLPAGIPWGLVPTGDYADCLISSGTLTCAFGTVPANTSKTVTVTGTTSLSDCGGVNNTATAWARLDTDANNNVSNAFIEVTCADVSIAKSASPTEVVTGANFTWILTITSLGPDAATNVTVTDTIPNGTVLAFGGNASAYCGTPSANVSCSIPSMGAGTYLVLEVTVSTVGAPCGRIENTARVGADVNTNTSNDESTANATVLCPFATRTQGFWSTHTNYTKTVFDAVWNGSMPIGTGSHVRLIDDYGKLFGAFHSSISSKTTGQKRNQIDSARMVLLQQLVAAKLNCQAFGCAPSTWNLITAADAAYAGNSKALMTNVSAQLDAYNNGGDSVPLPSTYGTWNPATPDVSRAIANRVFWDTP